MYATKTEPTGPKATRACTQEAEETNDSLTGGVSRKKTGTQSEKVDAGQPGQKKT